MRNVLKTSSDVQSDIQWVTLSVCPLDVNSEHKYKTYFCGNIFSLSLPNVYIGY